MIYRRGVARWAAANLYGKDKYLGLNTRQIGNERLTSSGTDVVEVRFDALEIKLATAFKQQGLPKEVFGWDRPSILDFFAGWLDADGTNASKGIRLYGDEPSIRAGQLLLRKVGIEASVNMMQAAGVKTNLGVRRNAVWYLQITKTIDIPSRRLRCNNVVGNRFKGKHQTVRSVVKLPGLHDTYCVTEPDKHQCLFGNVLTKQCNLTTQNGHKITSKERFRDATKAATIIGTLQAAYTHFPYLSPAARKLTEEEALLGVSITGMMENPQILLDPALQREMAALAVQTNAEWAKKIGINQAARITCVKPEGTSSIVLSTSSGIHPHHARRYFRRIQCNRLDNVFRHIRKINPHAVEESIYSATKTDDVITFPITVSDQSMVKDDLTALKHLDIIRSTQQNWVVPGTTLANTKPITHSVSCTVMVKEDEWQPVIDYLYENRDCFAAVSLLPVTGDKLYPQAPMEAVATEEDEKKWTALVDQWKHVDYKALTEEDDETQLQQEVACGSNGACELK
jgi:hypothetical protein